MLQLREKNVMICINIKNDYSQSGRSVEDYFKINLMIGCWMTIRIYLLLSDFIMFAYCFGWVEHSG